jgi:spore photoproduct lyase
MNKQKKSPDTLQLFSSALFAVLPEEDRQFIKFKSEEFRLSLQNVRKLIETAVDLRQWEEENISFYWDETGIEKLSGKDRSKLVLKRVYEKIDQLRNDPISYTNFTGKNRDTVSFDYIEKKEAEGSILGNCPVAGKKTRCCNLLTLDAVEQCGYACSYCSIQSFYDSQKIYFQNNFSEKLNSLKLDPDTLYHVGTGQSSDSLMWGNRNNILTDLFTFARKNPNVILELKTKSANISWADNLEVPANVVITWSLNAPTIITHEEHRTASLESRLSAARTLADKGVLVGFHFHPIVYFEGWEQEYRDITETIQHKFSVSETVMISLGTLTFIKPVLRTLRESGISSKVLQIPMLDTAGKYSYDDETKVKLFSHLFNSFSSEWQEHVFFYLCMEPHSLWNTVLGRFYENNEMFEFDMKNAYMNKVRLAR